jgi:amino acid transporter
MVVRLAALLAATANAPAPLLPDLNSRLHPSDSTPWTIVFVLTIITLLPAILMAMTPMVRLLVVSRINWRNSSATMSGVMFCFAPLILSGLRRSTLAQSSSATHARGQKLFSKEPASRFQPSTITNSRILSGVETTTGGN